MLTLKELVSNLLGVDKNSLNEESSPENISSWDSFNGLMLVSELETNFNVKFTLNEVISVKNFRDIKDALRRHGVSEGVDD
jgi:acyl carrier protein